MSVLLYAIVPATGDAAPDRSGLRGQPLRAIETAELRALVSDLPHALTEDVATMLEYEQVVESLLELCPALLPARFGTVAPADAAVRELLQSRAAQLQDALRQVAGAVEFAVRPPEADPTRTTAGPATADPEHPGTAYMQRLLQATEPERRLETAVNGLFRRCRPRRAGHSASYLVDRADATAFVQRLRELGATVTGPWPPYSFVQGDAR